MSLTNFLTLLGGLAMFLYGMHVMGASLEKRAGDRLKTLLSRLTASRIRGFLLGLGVTAIIQSSSATTVMVVGSSTSFLLSVDSAKAGRESVRHRISAISRDRVFFMRIASLLFFALKKRRAPPFIWPPL